MRNIIVKALVLAAVGGLAMAQPASVPASGLSTRPTGTTATATAAAPAPAELGPYAAVADEFKLVPAVQLRMRDAYQAMMAAQRKFLEARKQEWADAMAQAAGGGPEAQAGKEKVARLEAEYAAVTARGHAAVMGALTPQQRQTWEAKTLQTELVARLFPVTVGHGPDGQMSAQRAAPTAAQAAVIGEHCARAAKELHASQDPYDPPRRAAALERLVQAVTADLQAKNIPPRGAAPTE